MKILCFDTETSCLLSNNTKDKCHIIQLAWITYDSETFHQEENNFILNIDEEIKNSDIHHITTEMSKQGYRFCDIFEIFFEDVIDCDLIVGHNLNYDLNAVEIELYRIDEFEAVEVLYSKKTFDTMKMWAKEQKEKYPTLIGLHEKLFLQKFDNAHNALEDVRATLACYLQMNS